MKSRAAKKNSRGSVIVIVMITLLFATFALVAFIEKASNDLLVEQHEAESRRLRMEAYSALEVTLAVLEDFREVGNGLHSPAEGWNDPLTFAGYTPTEGRTVDVGFEDESGKISLPRTDAPTLSRLFQTWNLTKTDADTLADSLMGWMHRGHVYTAAVPPDYEQYSPVYEAPDRPLRSYGELAAIDKAHDVFYDENGQPNDLWRRFVAAVSLLNFSKPNINGAKPDALLAVGQFELSQQQNVNDYIAGTGNYTTQGPGYFQEVSDAQRISGAAGGDLSAFGTTISALRIFITVHDGSSQFRLAAVVTPQGGGATTVTQTATSERIQAANAAARANGQQANQAGAAQQNARPARPGNGQNSTTISLKYPFTLLEIRENDDIPPPPAPPAEPQ